MLQRLQTLARKIRGLRNYLLVLGLGALLLTLFRLLRSTSLAGDVLIVPAILVFTWCCLAYSLIVLFSSIELNTARPDRLLRRIQKSLKRLGLEILAYCLFALSLGLVIISFQLLRFWFDSY